MKRTHESVSIASSDTENDEDGHSQSSDTDSGTGSNARNHEEYSSEVTRWEKHYSELDRAYSRGNFDAADRLCSSLIDPRKWSDRVLRRPWTTMPDGSVRVWGGSTWKYAKEYRVVDGIREAWICLLMDYCKWDRAVDVADKYFNDAKCLWLRGKAHVALNKLHALLESRRVRDAITFLHKLLDGSGRMNQIVRNIEKSYAFQWHYTFARINFLQHEVDRAMHHAEKACDELDKSADSVSEPLQSRMWVFMIRAYSWGLACLGNKDYAGLSKVLQVWERTVCDLDRKSIQNTIGLKERSVFCRLKFIEFLQAMLRGCSELDIRNYSEDYLKNPENKDLVDLNRELTQRLRSVVNELQKEGNLSVEVSSSRYCPLLDQALTDCGYLSTSLQGLIDNWALVIDAGPVGNQARFANHCDDPNAVLAIGEACGARIRVLRAIKPISKNDEITVHYGVNYWDAIEESRACGLYKKYNGTEDFEISAKKRKKISGSPKTSDLYKCERKFKFKFFDGIVNDLNGSGLPATVLLQSMGERGTSAQAFDMEASCKQKGLRIDNCPRGHAAYPGKMLVADRDFSIGEGICIYAGVMLKVPVGKLQLRESDYLVSVCNSTCGPYGFELEDVGARTGPVFKKFQPGLPCPPTLSPDGLTIPLTEPRTDLSGIEDIKGLGPYCTSLILMGLQNEECHEMLRRLFKRLHRLPDKNWKTAAQVEIKKAFTNLKKQHEIAFQEEEAMSTACNSVKQERVEEELVSVKEEDLGVFESVQGEGPEHFESVGDNVVEYKKAYDENRSPNRRGNARNKIKTVDPVMGDQTTIPWMPDVLRMHFQAANQEAKIRLFRE